ncbi:MAG: protein-L-isoaspartate O-methyltransferase [Rhodocyclaceae bacterium]|nr:protein-L-isoaspartate O-methyltransferase [Rhodocyclaceae bacterium]
MNLEKARFNMVEQQIRPWEVLDTDVLDLLMAVKREDFVPAAHQALAFADLEVPLGHGASMLPPRVEGRIMQAIQVKKSDKILEVGAGSGFLTALLATKADHVYALEIVPELAEMARANLEKAGIVNAQVEVADGSRGSEAHAPYDVIVLGGAVSAIPKEVLGQLKAGGRLFAIVGAAPCMFAQLVSCSAPGVYQTETLFETVVKPLANTPQAGGFVF